VIGRPMPQIALFVAVLAMTPLAFHSNVVLNFLAFAMIVALAAQGWNVLGGYGGQFSFGHAAFFGAGAYTMALAQVRFGLNPWLALPLAVAVAAGIAWVIGFLSFRARLRGSYFALVTLAFAEVMRIAANAWGFTGGASGLLVPLRIDTANMQFADRRMAYWLAVALVGIAMVITQRLAESRFGAQLVAIRENEDAARALGVDTLATKLKAIALSGGMTGAAGAIYAQKFLYLDAGIAFGPWISVEALLAPIIGGVGTVFGPVLGALVLLGLGETTKALFSALFGGAWPGADLVLFGALLILCVAFAPRGLAGLLTRPKGVKA